jgi:hypothetical protein
MRKRSTRRPGLIALVLATAAAFVLSLTVTAAVSAAPHHHAHKHGKKHKKNRKARGRKAAEPVSGIYDACAYDTPKQTPLPNCDDRLLALRQGGFRVVLNYWNSGTTVDEYLRYADHAASLGMQVIWNIGDYSRTSMESKLDLVRTTMNHPGTWGYYIGDEHPDDLPQVTELSRAVRGMTKRPLLYVSRPNPSKLRPFKGVADYLGPDIYPVGPIDQQSVCRTAQWSSRMVKNNLAMVLQAYSWSIDFPSLDPQWPSAAQMRQMRNQATHCGDPKLIMWFCFHCITDYNPDPDAYWRQLAWAANGAAVSPDYRMTSASS